MQVSLSLSKRPPTKIVKTIHGVTLFLLAFIAFNAQAAYRIVVFPLVNNSNDKLYQWISYAPAESFFRSVQSMTDIRMWSPTFLFPVDSMGWTMVSDSLLRIHWTRWEWDGALGGGFTVSDGIISADIKLYVVKNGRVIKKKLTARASVDKISGLCADIFAQMLDGLGLKLPPAEMTRIMQPVTSNPAAYPTFLAAFGYEMRGRYSAAITAYSRVCEIDPLCVAAACAIGKLYSMANAADSARIYFKKCESSGAVSPEILAETANFYVDHDPPGKALAFVSANRQALDQSPLGMKVIGKSLLLSGELQRAVASLNRSLSMGAPDLDLDFLLGKTYLSTEDFSKASDVFNRLVKYRPDYPVYYAFLGNAYRLSGKPMESVRILEAALKMAPDNVQVGMTLAQTYVDLGWYKNAYQILLRIKDKAPEAPELLVDLGVVLWHMGKQEEASALFQQAEKIGPTKQSILVNEANIYACQGDVRKAISLYQKADKSGRKNDKVLMNLGNAYLSIGKLKAAAECFNEVLSLAPQRLDVLKTQAFIAEKLKRDKDAEAYLRKIIDVSPHDLDAIERLMTILTRQKRFKEALEPLESYINDFPNNKKALLMLAGCYRAMEWYEVAMMKYQIVIRDFPDSWEGYLGLGKSMYDAIAAKKYKDYDKAIYYLKSASDKAPDNPEPDYLIGILYLDYKNYRELAVDHLKKALARATDESMRKTIGILITKTQ